MQHRVGLRLSWSIAVFDMVVRYHSLFNIDPSSPPAIDFSTILQKQDDGTEEEMKGALFNKKRIESRTYTKGRTQEALIRILTHSPMPLDHFTFSPFHHCTSLSSQCSPDHSWAVFEDRSWQNRDKKISEGPDSVETKSKQEDGRKKSARL